LGSDSTTPLAVILPVQSGSLDTLRALSTALDRLGVPSMIIGGVAVIAHSVPRLTVVNDATVVAAGLDVGEQIRVRTDHDIRARIPTSDPWCATPN
jgi:plasmid replication initiation protein